MDVEEQTEAASAGADAKKDKKRCRTRASTNLSIRYLDMIGDVTVL